MAEHPSAIRGRVLGAGGPVAGATVMLFAVPGGRQPQQVLFDFDTGPDLCDPAAPPSRDRAEELASGLAAHEEEPPLVAAATSDGEGRFELSPVAGGAYSVWVESPSGVAAHAPVHAGEDVDLRAAPGWFARGRVRDQDRQPLAGATVAAVPSIPGATVEGTTSADGAFSLGPLAGDRYELVAARDGLLPIKAIAVRERQDEGFLRLRVPGRISGRVVRGDRGVEGADVCVDDTFGVIHVRTGPDGRFSVDRVRPGVVRIRGGIGNEQVETSLRVPPDDDDVTLSLEKAVRVVGTVRDESGGAVANASVTVFATSGARAVRTAADGSFRAEGLAPGGASVAASAPGLLEATSRPQVTEPGGEVRFDVVLKRPFVISGAVADAEGAAVAGAFVVAARAGGDDERSAFTDERGAFSIGCETQGRYELRVGHDLFRDATAQATAPGSVTIALDRGLSLEGVLLGEEGEPLPGRMMTVSAAQTGGAKAPMREVETDNRGMFRVGGLTEGKYLVEAFPDDPPGKGDQLASATIEVPARQKLVLRALPCGQLAGTVLDEDGRPVWGALVDAREEDPPERNPEAPCAGSPWQSGFTDERGHFELRRLREGTYRVTASAAGNTGDELHPMLVAGPVSARTRDPEIVLRLRPGDRMEIEALDFGMPGE